MFIVQTQGQRNLRLLCLPPKIERVALGPYQTILDHKNFARPAAAFQTAVCPRTGEVPESPDQSMQIRNYLVKTAPRTYSASSESRNLMTLAIPSGLPSPAICEASSAASPTLSTCWATIAHRIQDACIIDGWPQARARRQCAHGACVSARPGLSVARPIPMEYPSY